LYWYSPFVHDLPRSASLVGLVKGGKEKVKQVDTGIQLNDSFSWSVPVGSTADSVVSFAEF